jgi:hypothetical protein
MIFKATLNWLRNNEEMRSKYLEYLELKDRMDALEPAIKDEYSKSRPKTSTSNYESDLPWMTK